jgi:phage tail-like protein
MASLPPKFKQNPQRLDPYRNFKFLVKIDNTYVAGLNKCSALKKTTEKTDWYECGDPSTPHRLPGKTSYEAITLSAGVTHDTAFEDWANQVNNFKSDSAMSLKNFRKNLTIEVYNEAGQIAIAYQVFRCWVSEYQALPELDAAGNAVMIQTIKLENEGWQRDANVKEPKET